MKLLFAAVTLVCLLSSAASAATGGCDTDARVAAFETLLKTHPARAAVEDFIRKNHMRRDKMYAPRKSPARLVVSISESDCDPADYQHTMHIFDVAFKKGVVTSYTESLMSGGP